MTDIDGLGMIARKINWVQSLHPDNGQTLRLLELKLADFYATNPNYYNNIDFTSANWTDAYESGYAEIVKVAMSSQRMCEVGCGSANILKHYSTLEPMYFGCDFSPELMAGNKLRYPSANFRCIDEPNTLPFEDAFFDFIFLVFVLEHSTNPAHLLDECSRILKPGGKLIILCPDFLGQGRMTSQRAGWSEGTASQKLKKGKIFDAFLTLFDNRIRIPFTCRLFATKADKTPLFLVNVSPVVFEDNFLPDVDAVYVTYKNEIERYLKDRFMVNENLSDIASYEKERKIIFLSLTKY